VQLNYGNRVYSSDDRRAGEIPGNVTVCAATWRCSSCPSVQRTWGIRPDLSAKATESVRREHPNFLFMAEVYWIWMDDAAPGVDYAYDKRLYDRLREGTPGRCASIFSRGWITRASWRGFWKTMTSRGRPRRLPRSSRGGAVITFLSPGCVFFIKVSSRADETDLAPSVRGSVEPVNQELEQFYDRLLSVLRQPVLARANGNCSKPPAGKVN